MLFGLALLLPALASAAVEMKVKVRCGEDVTEKTLVFTHQENEHGITHDSGVDTKFVLTGETAEKALFDIVVSKGEEVINRASITTEYNKEESLKCPSEQVNAEIVVTVTSLAVANQ